MRRTIPLISLCGPLACLPQASQAASYTSTDTVVVGDNWNGSHWQLNGTGPEVGPPTAGSTYALVFNGTAFGDAMGNTRTRNPAVSGVQTFPGDSLTINRNTELRMKNNGSILNFPGVNGNPGLILNGGVINVGDDGNFPITGTIQVASPSYLCPGNNGGGGLSANARSMDIQGRLTGSATLALFEASLQAAQRISGNSNTFSGPWIVKAGWLLGAGTNSLGTNDITIDPGFVLPEPPLDPSIVEITGPAQLEVDYDINSAGTLILSNGGVFVLHQNCCFSAVVIEGIPLTPGTHAYADLTALYPANLPAGGTGTVTVQPYGNPPPAAWCQAELVVNGGFESGSSGWTLSGAAQVGAGAVYAHTGTHSLWLGGTASESYQAYQSVQIPGNATAATFSFWFNIVSQENPWAQIFDTLYVSIRNTGGTILAALGPCCPPEWSNVNQDPGVGNPYYHQQTFDLSPYKGQAIVLHFSGSNSGNNGLGYRPTWFLIDDVSVSVAEPPPGSFTLSNETPFCDTTPPAGPAVRLNWAASSGAVGYQVYCNGSPIGSSLSSGTTSFLNNLSVTAGLTNTYFVRATNAAGFTDSSTIAVAIPADVCISAPTIVAQPQSQTTQAGANVVLSLTAVGTDPLSYQWQFNMQTIAGATSSTLALNSVTAAASGGYSVVVWNAYGSVVSAAAFLSVLADGANGNQPEQIVAQPVPSKPSVAKNLLLITHGWEPGLIGPPLPQWVSDMADAIEKKVSSDWYVAPYYWLDKAWTLSPQQALANAENIGTQLGKEIGGTFQSVHLIAHSAGSALIQAVADQLESSPNPPLIQMTFLDPFLGLFLEKQGVYGQNADWADCYFTQDWTGGFTGGDLVRAYNVDVDWVDPNHFTLPYGSAQVAFSTHEYSHEFYIDSVTNTDPQWCGTGYGFTLSAEAGGRNNQARHPTGNRDNPNVLCGPSGTIPSPNLPLTETEIVLADLANAFNSGVSFLVNGGANLTADGPAWLAVGVPITNSVNFVQLDAAFIDGNTAEGLLTVYWNTNQLGMVDERTASVGLQTYRFMLPDTVTNGLYTLSFRLDAFNPVTSSITVTNVATGFLGLTTPATLGMQLGTNGRPVLQLTGAAGYNYLLQSSPDLVNWIPTAFLTNSNGTVSFADPTCTNCAARFYRAIVP
jgi:hypothetical protein